MVLFGLTMINLFFYRKHDSQHRPRKIFQHKLGTSSKEDKLIFEEKSERFTCSISTSSCENYYFIDTSEHTTSEVYYFHKDEKEFKPKIIINREEGIQYTIDSLVDGGGCGQIKMQKILK